MAFKETNKAKTLFFSVNTMHGWPQFITIISWLIDRINLDLVYNNFKEQQEEEVKAAMSMFDSVFGYLSVQHYIASSEVSTPLKLFRFIFIWR